MHNWSSKLPKRVFSNILEILGKALQLYYYHQDIIPCLNKSNNIIIQIYSEDMQKPDSKLIKSITPKPAGLKS